jgi:hypothetical protein
MTTDSNYAGLYYSNIVNDIDALKNNVKEYPHSSIARFLLLYHYKKNNHPGFAELAKQTGIYFNNLLWIQYQLSLADRDNLSKEKIENFFKPEKQISDTPENVVVDEEKEEDFFESENQNEISQENIPVAVEEEKLQIPVSEKIEGNEERNDSGQTKEDEELIAFEPLHTIDYFASQGIKISEEALENDQLGRQVKSFTAWLKSMKKLHPGQLPEQNEVIEKIIQATAEVSNQNANVLTEAMAEVLVKQDKKDKAIEMYQKLSLMNPSKSAYFAAKIESLKIV